MRGVSNAGVRDQVVAFCSPAALREPLVRNISRNQDLAPSLQVLVPAAVLVCLCEALGMDPHEVVSLIQRAKSDVDSPYANQWRAMEAYARGEL